MGSFRGDELEQENFTNELEEYHARLDRRERFGEWCRPLLRADENLPDEGLDLADCASEGPEQFRSGDSQGATRIRSPRPNYTENEEETT